VWQDSARKDYDMANKWVLHHGIHRGTITSRDTGSEEYDTEQEARDAFKNHKDFYSRIGYVIWFAYLVSPEGKKTAIDAGNTNYR